MRAMQESSFSGLMQQWESPTVAETFGLGSPPESWREYSRKSGYSDCSKSGMASVPGKQLRGTKFRVPENNNFCVTMAYFHGKRSAWHGFLPAVAVVCLLLLALLAVAQVAHQHASSTDADQCQLCVVLHTVAPVAVAAVVIVMVQLGSSAPQAEPKFVARQRQSRLFIRPPPVSC
jgi:hypothetical protein